MIDPTDAKLVDDLTSLVSRAAAAVLALRDGALNPRTKPDLSPVTAADEAAEAVLLQGIARLMPGVPVISEEAAGATAMPATGREFVLIDPLDGTRELLAGRDEFTINVALLRDGFPILGVVAAPGRGIVWRTAAGSGAERLRLTAGAPAQAAGETVAIRTRAMPRTGAVAAVSRSHLDPATEAFLGRLRNATRMVCGSAIKLCYVAEGAADIYPRLAPTFAWDVAAGHAVLAAAGGCVTTPAGSPLSYRADGDMRIPGFVAWGDASTVVAAAD